MRFCHEFPADGPISQRRAFRETQLDKIALGRDESSTHIGLSEVVANFRPADGTFSKNYAFRETQHDQIALGRDESSTRSG